LSLEGGPGAQTDGFCTKIGVVVSRHPFFHLRVFLAPGEQDLQQGAMIAEHPAALLLSMKKGFAGSELNRGHDFGACIKAKWPS
jgi:hypothetical protein